MKCILLITLSLYNLIPLSACECPPLKTLDKEYTNQFDLVFLGTVDSVTPCDKQARAIFVIEKLFKGTSLEKTEVNFDCSTSCQMSFAKGEQWIIYANYVKYATPEVDFCNRSRKKFINSEVDYYEATNGLSFSDELLKLKEYLGEKTLKKNNADDVQRDLIKPKGFTVLWLLLISTAVLGVSLYFSKGLKK